MLPTEVQILDSIREEGFELIYMVHSDRADWDRYISSNQYHSSRWLKENRDHPDWADKLKGHRRWPDSMSDSEGTFRGRWRC